MIPADLLAELRSLGVTLTLSPERRLRYKAPRGVITPELFEAIQTHREPLLDLVERGEERATVEQEEAHPAADSPQLPPCALCGGDERWDDHNVLRCVACYPPGSMTLKRTMETLLACRRCGSLAPPVGGTVYEDGSVLLRCPDCQCPRAVLTSQQDEENA
jgi:hypothetical protein